MREDDASTWVAVAPVTDLASETARVVRAAGLELALIRTPAGFFALDNTCPHSGGPLIFSWLTSHGAGATDTHSSIASAVPGYNHPAPAGSPGLDRPSRSSTPCSGARSERRDESAGVS